MILFQGKKQMINVEKGIKKVGNIPYQLKYARRNTTTPLTLFGL